MYHFYLDSAVKGVIWYFSFSDLLQSVWQSLGLSMLLQMALFHSFNGWVIFHCVYMYHIFFIHSSANGHRELYCKCFFVQERDPLSWVHTREWDCWAAGRSGLSLSGRCHIVLLELLCWAAECAHRCHRGALLTVFCVLLSLTLCLIFLSLCPNIPIYSFLSSCPFL